MMPTYLEWSLFLGCISGWSIVVVLLLMLRYQEKKHKEMIAEWSVKALQKNSPKHGWQDKAQDAQRYYLGGRAMGKSSAMQALQELYNEQMSRQMENARRQAIIETSNRNLQKAMMNMGYDMFDPIVADFVKHINNNIPVDKEMTVPQLEAMFLSFKKK